MKRLMGKRVITPQEAIELVEIRNDVCKKGKKYTNTLEMFGTFDIETTYIESIKQSFMYHWQMYINDYVIFGRTWKEFRDFMKHLHYLAGDNKLVIYVHNLSYEFMFLSGIYNFFNEDVMATDIRKVLKCTMLDNIEFRCSYQLSNMSLSEYTDKMKVEHRKLTNSFDYDIIRTSKTILTQLEEEYCLCDVVGLHEAISKDMEITKDNIETIPLTSTGYVRRDVRKVMYKYKHTLIDKIYPTIQTYRLLREAFRGGNTHANRYYTGRIIKDVKSIDRASSYPDVIMNCKFPMTQFKNIGESTESELERHIKSGKACLFQVCFANIRLKDELWGCPYLTFDKSRGCYDYELDNGRILNAQMLETTITDIDWDIIKSQYNWDKCVIIQLSIADYGELPKELKEVVNSYFKGKTELKDVEEMILLYNKSKNKLNANFGMMVQNPVKIPIIYNGGNWDKDENAIEQELLNDYRKTAFLVYQWGVWVTAHARMELEKAIRLSGHRFIYCDTDSVKYFGETIDITKYNAERMYLSEMSGSYAKNKRGKIYFMGVYENDGYYTEFITYGAKKYAYIDEKGELHITIAGVNKSKGAKELERAGGIKALKEGFIFRDAGGTESIYNDNAYGRYILNGEEIYITRNVAIRPSTYQFGVTSDYRQLIDRCEEIGTHLLQNY